jgi:hypothetical protein
MKSIILENKQGQAVLLSEDGTFTNQKGITSRVGTETTSGVYSKRHRNRFRGLVAAAAVALVVMGAGSYAYATPYYYLSLDVNPSVQMEANVFGKVISLEAANDDGVAIVDGKQYKNKSADKVMAEIVERIGEEGYLDSGDNDLLIAAASKDEKKATIMANKLAKAAEKEMKKNGFKNDIITDHYGYDMVQQAKAYGMTPGKYNLVTHVLGQTIGSQEDADMYMNMSVRDLMKAYKEKKHPEKTNNGKGN